MQLPQLLKKFWSGPPLSKLRPEEQGAIELEILTSSFADCAAAGDSRLQSLTKVAKRLAQPPAREEGLVGGKAPLLKSTAGTQHGEEYSNDEQLLNEFLKVPPMMSFDMTNKEVGALLASMMVRKPSAPPELPCVPKSYDDSMLR